MTLGERVYQLRRAQGITQERLAEKSGVLRITITRLEKGTQATSTWQTVAKLAKSFGLTMDEFLKDVDADVTPAVA